MANRIQIRRGTAANLVGAHVYQGELLWVTDKKKLYIGTDEGNVGGSFPKYEHSTGQSYVKVISPDASEVAYDNTTLSTPDKLDATTVQGAIDELATEKQMKLGGTISGTSMDGRAIIASSTSGIVTYREIDDTISSSSDGSNHLVTANAAYDSLHALDLAKQDKPGTATSNNIAVFDANRNTIDSGKTWTLAVSGDSTDNQIPTAKAVNTAISDAMTAAVNYRGACKESQLPQSGQKVGDYWTITDFDTSYEGQHRDGRAIWNGSDWDKVVDDFYGPDNEYIELTQGTSGNDGSSTSPKLTIKDQTRENTTSTQTATFSGNISVVDSVTTNPKGQVVSVNTKTITLPGLGYTSTTAAQGDLAEYIANKTTSIRNISTADNTKYPTELAVRTELDTKADKSNVTASTNYSLVNYNSSGIVISSIDYIDGGTF